MGLGGKQPGKVDHVCNSNTEELRQEDWHEFETTCLSSESQVSLEYRMKPCTRMCARACMHTHTKPGKRLKGIYVITQENSSVSPSEVEILCGRENEVLPIKRTVVDLFLQASVLASRKVKVGEGIE